MAMVDLAKVRQAIREVTINRHEYLLTQGQCHKKNCPCQATMQRGDPEAALNLFITTVLNDLRTVELFGMTPREVEEENYRQEVESSTRKN